MPKGIIYTTIFMLFIAIFRLPYSYYVLLHFVVTITFIWAAFISYEKNKEFFTWSFFMLALIFNPIIKLHFQKETWMFIDIISGVYLIFTKKYVEK